MRPVLRGEHPPDSWSTLKCFFNHWFQIPICDYLFLCSHSLFWSTEFFFVSDWLAFTVGNCCCTNSSNEWNVQLKGARHRRTSAKATANKEWDSLFALFLRSVGNEALYTADQMIRRSNTLYSRRAITTRANTMTTMVHSIVHSND
jgi:hypothetical protein